MVELVNETQIKKNFNIETIPVYILYFLICFTYPVLFVVPPPYLSDLSKLLCVDELIIILLCLSALVLKWKDLSLLLKNNIYLQTIYFFLPLSLHSGGFITVRWVIIPLFAIVYYDTLKKTFPYFLTFLWGVNLLHSIFIYAHNIEFYGLACNRNWHACFLLVTTPFVVTVLYDKLKKCFSAKSAKIVSLLPVVITIPILIKCQSRGAVLSLCISSLVILYILFSDKYKKIMRISILAIALIAVVFFGKHLKEHFHQMDMADIRIPLWESTINLIKDNVFGVGEASFESKLCPYMTEDYFLRKHVAPRSIHPHNHILYFWGCYGIIALFMWGLFNMYAMRPFFTKKKVSSDKLLLLFSFLCLFIHGNLDLVLFVWPTNYIFLIVLGLLIHSNLDISKDELCEHSKKSIYCKLISIIFACIAIFFIQQNLRSSHYRICANIAEKEKNFEQALFYYNKSIKIKQVPLTIYKAAQVAFNLNKYQLTIDYLKLLQTTPKYTIANSNYLLATSYCMIRQEEKALPYFIANVAKYKLSIKGWYLLFKVQKHLKKYDDAKYSLQKIYYCMKRHNIKFKHLPALLLDNSENYDIRPYNLLNKKIETEQYKDIYNGLIKEFNEIEK